MPFVSRPSECADESGVECEIKVKIKFNLNHSFAAGEKFYDANQEAIEATASYGSEFNNHQKMSLMDNDGDGDDDANEVEERNEDQREDTSDALRDQRDEVDYGSGSGGSVSGTGETTNETTTKTKTTTSSNLVEDIKIVSDQDETVEVQLKEEDPVTMAIQHAGELQRQIAVSILQSLLSTNHRKMILGDSKAEDCSREDEEETSSMAEALNTAREGEVTERALAIATNPKLDLLTGTRTSSDNNNEYDDEEEDDDEDDNEEINGSIAIVEDNPPPIDDERRRRRRRRKARKKRLAKQNEAASAGEYMFPMMESLQKQLDEIKGVAESLDEVRDIRSIFQSMQYFDEDQVSSASETVSRTLHKVLRPLFQPYRSKNFYMDDDVSVQSSFSDLSGCNSMTDRVEQNNNNNNNNKKFVLETTTTTATAMTTDRQRRRRHKPKMEHYTDSLKKVPTLKSVIGDHRKRGTATNISTGEMNIVSFLKRFGVDLHDDTIEDDEYARFVSSNMLFDDERIKNKRRNKHIKEKANRTSSQYKRRDRAETEHSSYAARARRGEA